MLKSNPGKLSYASNGNGSYSHMAMEMFKRGTGVDLAHVPYKGAAQAETDVIGGQVTLMFDSTSTGAEFVKSGRLRSYGVSSRVADPVLPQQPPIAVQGVAELKDFDVAAWSALLAPRDTPPAIVNALNAAVRDILADPAFRAQMLARSHAPVAPGAVSDMAKLIRSDRAKWGELVKVANIRLD